MPEQPKDIGQVLKACREGKGISLDIVHEATKIPIDSLKAIEEGYKVRTLTSFYYKSFVRLYAQYLGLNPEPLLLQISPAQTAKAPMQRTVSTPVKKVMASPAPGLLARPLPLTKQRQAAPWKPAAALAVAVVFLVLIVGGIRHLLTTRPPATAAGKEKITAKVKPVSATAREKLLKAEELKREEAGRGVEQKKPSAMQAEASRKAEAGKKTEPAKQVVKAELVKSVEKQPASTAAQPAVSAAAVENKTAASTETKTIPAKATTKKVSVAVRAFNNAWLNVRADGSPVFQGILKKGTFDSWQAAKTIDISGKDIDQLEFEVNGKPVGRLSRRGAPARKIHITPDGLIVEK